MERQEEARDKFRQELESLSPEQIVYLDESGVDDRIHREYGRALTGREVPGEVNGKRVERLSMIASLRGGKKLEAPFALKATAIRMSLMPGLKNAYWKRYSQEMLLFWIMPPFILLPKQENSLKVNRHVYCHFQPIHQT
jgi:hypothetical protein